MNVAIIPARAGSKRIPKKNIKEFLGKPMIAYPIQIALKSALFDKVIVSTDSNEIAKIAETLGAEAPFLRPTELADDYIGTTSVIKHALEMLLDSGYEPELICCIYATTPLLDTKYLKKGYEKIKDSNLDYVFSATTFPFPVQRAIKIDAHGLVSPLYPQHVTSRSQDLEELYHDAAQFYWGTKKAWLSNSHTYLSKTSCVILPRYAVQDIDTLEDWQRAEILYQLVKNTN